MNLVFLKRMNDMLGSEYDNYLKTLEEPLYRGLRVNTLKTTTKELETYLSFPFINTPFHRNSYYIDSKVRSLGNHPAHLCGLFYMQEPSASSAVEILDVKKGDWVLDLCAAPGGKSSQIASALNHQGFLLSNEIDKKRANILLSNLERLGIYHNMVVSSSPDILCPQLQGCFDRVLVDAPCSGEGMFKKHDKAIDAWSEEHVQTCAKRQLHILESAYLTLKKEGVLVYSTCTYATEENEAVIANFLNKYPDMELVPTNVEFGRVGFPYDNLNHEYVRRIFPMDQGEGHFIAKMVRRSENIEPALNYMPSNKPPKEMEVFLSEYGEVLPKHINIQKDQVYISNLPFIKLKNAIVLRQGTQLGTMMKNRLEPHQHFYTSQLFNKRRVYELKDEEELKCFISGNVLNVENIKGYVAILWNGHILGFGKGDQFMIKNKYPKGLRINY